MNKCFILYFFLFSLLVSCKKEEDISPTDVPAKTAQEAKARLTARTKWIIDEALIDGNLIYKRSQTPPEEGIVELEWCRFTDNGIFELKYIDDPVTEKLYYKLDEANNRILISYDEESTYVENWTIKVGSVYSDKFEMELEDEEGLVYLKMVALP